MFKFDKPIDIVYTWVNGNDGEWQAEKLQWMQKLGLECGDSVNNCRFIDNSELKFSLRSVMKNAPWINHIFIVTNGQVPSWLDTSHPKITIVKHQEIMPASVLPTFNSNAIEACIANIKDLSEYFIYANDDCFMYRPVSPNFFFTRDGKPIVYLKKHSWSTEQISKVFYYNQTVYSTGLVNKKYFQYEAMHNLTPFRKSYFKQCVNEYNKEFDFTKSCRFRTNNTVTHFLISVYMIDKKLGIGKFIDKPYKFSDIMYMSLDNPEILDGKLKRNPYLMCINDGEKAIDDYRIRLKGYLSKLYPNRQPWEKSEDFKIKPAFGNQDCINLVFAFDNAFYRYFGVALKSLIVNSSPQKKYDIVVFESDITERHKKLLLDMLPENFSIRFFDPTSYIIENFKDFDISSSGRWSSSIYYRLFIPFVMSDYDRILYLDSDILVIDDLVELFEIDISNFGIAAVRDTISPILHLNIKRFAHFKNNLKLNNPENYFNSGVLLFNLKNINNKSYFEKLMHLLYIKDLMHPDQDILNCLFEDKVKFLPARYNYMCHACQADDRYLNLIDGEYKIDFINARQNPQIIHYSGKRKPWKFPDGEKAFEFWEYARQTNFYEAIIYVNSRSLPFSSDTLINLIQRRKINFNYIKYKLFSIITFGHAKEHYYNKRNLLKKRVIDIRKYSNAPIHNPMVDKI